MKRYSLLITGASLKDGLWITIFYTLTYLIFDNTEILTNKPQLILFLILCLVFSFIDEKVSIGLKRWEYSKHMPKILGVGLTPLVELAITGVLTFIYVFLV